MDLSLLDAAQAKQEEIRVSRMRAMTLTQKLQEGKSRGGRKETDDNVVQKWVKIDKSCHKPYILTNLICRLRIST